MKISLTIDEKFLKQLIVASIADKLGNTALTTADVVIEVKSKQNYKSEWETASFRARYEGEV